ARLRPALRSVSGAEPPPVADDASGSPGEPAPEPPVHDGGSAGCAPKSSAGSAPMPPDQALADLERAFSIRRNLRLLFVPSEGRLGPVDGLRALSMLWVVLFHAGWYMGERIPRDIYAELVFSPRMLPVWRGDFGVDVFFVLSGFLIAGML